MMTTSAATAQVDTLDEFRKNIAVASPQEVEKTLGLRSPGKRSDVHFATVATLERMEQFSDAEAAPLLAKMFLSFETSNYFGDGHKLEGVDQVQLHKERQELLLLILLKAMHRPRWIIVAAPRIAFALGFFFHKEFVLQILDVLEPHIDIDELMVCATVSGNDGLSAALIRHCAERRIHGLEARRFVDLSSCAWRVNHPSRSGEYMQMFVDDLIKSRMWGLDDRLGVALDAKLLDESAALCALQNALKSGRVEGTVNQAHKYTLDVARIIEELLEYRPLHRSIRERLHSTAAFSEDAAIQEANAEAAMVDVDVLWGMFSHYPAVVEEFADALLTLHNATVVSDKSPMLALLKEGARIDHYGWRQSLKILVDHGLDLKLFNEKAFVLHVIAGMVEKHSKKNPVKAYHVLSALRHLVLDYDLSPFLKDRRRYTPLSYLGRSPEIKGAWADLMLSVKARQASRIVLDEIQQEFATEALSS